MRILVTGGAGFIASHVVDAFLREGHEVAVLDNLSTGLKANINPQARFYQADIRDTAEIERIFAEFQPQVLNHHAAQIDVRKSVENPIYDAEVNILGSLNLLQASLRHGVDKFIYASSCGIYGEPDYLPIDEKHPIRPISAYGISKHTVEHYLDAYGKNHGLNFTAFRYSNAYGPRQSTQGEAGVVAIFTGRMLAGEQPVIFGTGEVVRDFVFVEDIARANVLSLTSGNRQILNIGSGTGTSIKDLYQMIAEATEYSCAPLHQEPKLGDIETSYLDCSLAASELEWKAQINLKEGLRRTVEYNKGNG